MSRTAKMKDMGPFWAKPLEDLTRAEWEKLCDGCGRCCLVKLEDEDTGVIFHTSIGCALLDSQACRCRHYASRQKKIADCLRLTPAEVPKLSWLPPTCAYRLRAEGKELPAWHPLLTGDPESVHEARVSVRGRVEASEDELDADDLPNFIVTWPKRWPKKRRTPSDGGGL